MADLPHSFYGFEAKLQLLAACICFIRLDGDYLGKILVVAEKPSVGRDIAKVLGCKQKGEGFLSSDTHIVSWAIGHLITLAEPEDYDKAYAKWSMKTLPIIPPVINLKPVTKTAAQLKTLKNLMNSPEVSSIICATDSGREGELIFRYIYTYVKCKKPFSRLWISSMTDAAIKAGFADIKDGSEYDNLFHSAKCRSEADWLVGINASRAFTVKYNALLSLGRVQTPTLALIVERQNEITRFVPENFYEVLAEFEPKYLGKYFDKKANSSRIDNEEKADAIVGKTNEKHGFVKSIESEEKKIPHPLLYDLTELQRDCNKRFGYSAAKTLSIAQDLYEKKKLITYPRTDSRYLSEDMVPKLSDILKRLADTHYKPYTDHILSAGSLSVTKRFVDGSKVSDHHAIIPSETKINVGTLTKEELNVFDLIARRFICVFYPAYVYNSVKITTEVETELFITKGKTIVEYGWNEIYKNEPKQKDEAEEAELPNISEGDNVFLKKAKKEKKTTKPPAQYTEASLLSAMENAGKNIDDETLREQMKDSGLGTPATRAAIIERLIAVNYIFRKGKSLVPTEKGLKIVEIIPNELKSSETTGKWEKGLANISKGSLDSSRFMQSIERYVRYLVDFANKNDIMVAFPEEKKKTGKKTAQKPLGTCPLCSKGSVLENTKAYYCSEWKSGCKFNIWKDALKNYCYELKPAALSKLLTDKKLTGIEIIIPDVKQKRLCDIVFDCKLPITLTVTNIRTHEASASSAARETV